MYGGLECYHHALTLQHCFSPKIAMERWFSTGKRRSPVTNEVLSNRSTQLTPNRVLKTQIQAYRREVGSKLLASCAAPVASKGDSGGGGGSTEETTVRPLTSLSLAAYVDAGADVNIRDRDGNTPLLLLVQGGRLGLALELLECGARASQRNDLGEQPPPPHQHFPCFTPVGLIQRIVSS